jgi:hypothetical protein
LKLTLFFVANIPVYLIVGYAIFGSWGAFLDAWESWWNRRIDLSWEVWTDRLKMLAFFFLILFMLRVEYQQLFGR